MIKYLLSLISLLILSSCASVFTKKTYEMEVKSQTYSRVKVNDSSFFLPAKIQVKRSKKDLPMVFSNDSISRNFILKPSLNPTFLFGNLAIMPPGVGYLVDLSNEKRFYYGKSVTVNTNDTLSANTFEDKKQYKIPKKNVRNNFRSDFETTKGQINFIISIPYVNSFHFNPINETSKNNTGFLGFGTGVEYFYKENNFMGLYASGVIDFMIPAPAPIRYDGEHEFFSSLAIGLTHNQKINRFTFGYGLNYARNIWKLSNNDYDPLIETSRKPVTKSNNSLGLIANGYFQFGKRFFVGLNYKPSLFSLNASPKFNYEHVISLDFVWKFKIKQ